MLATDFDIPPAVAAGATKAARLAGGNLAAVRVGVRSLARLLHRTLSTCARLVGHKRRG